MNRVLHHVVAGGLAVLAFACNRDRVADSLPVASSVTASPPPVDHLGPDELLEGTEQVFALRLPRGVHVDATFSDVAYISGNVPLASLSSYLRTRLQGGDARVGDAAVSFERVAVPNNPSRLLRISAERVGLGVKGEIRDVTPVQPPVLPDEASRWRRVGLTADGRLADPTHLE